MKIIAAVGAACLALCSAPAGSEGSALYPVTENFGGAPPPRFRGPASAWIEFTDQARVEEACGVAPQPWTRFGCARRGFILGNSIVMTGPCYFADTEVYARRLCHELAHLNGWPRRHGP